MTASTEPFGRWDDRTHPYGVFPVGDTQTLKPIAMFLTLAQAEAYSAYLRRTGTDAFAMRLHDEVPA